jgi:hypothetical protein
MKYVAVGLVVVCSAIVVGCGSNGVQTKAPPGFANGVQPATPSPEVAIAKLETPEDRAAYLRQLKEDNTFEPQKHTDMLKKCASESDQEVAAVAKELLERN